MGCLAAGTGRRLDGKPLAPPVPHVIKDLIGDIGSHLFPNEKIQFADPLYLFRILWLIQSQPQTGSASAKAFEDHPQTFAGIFSEKLPQLFAGLLGNLHHRLPCSFEPSAV